MKKAAKVLLIIGLILLVVFIGYKLYEKYYLSKYDVIETDEGLSIYSSVRSKSLGEEEWTVSYSLKEDRERTDYKESGDITIDDFGYYQEWEGTAGGSKYIVKASSGYAVFDNENGTLTSSKITDSEYNNNYSGLAKLENLTFLSSPLLVTSEDSLRNTLYSFADNVVSEGNFEHIFGEYKGGGYIWKTTYECVYIEGGVRFSSKLVREVKFDKRIESVKIEITDKEVDSADEVVKKGEKKSLNVTYKIQYKTNQTLIETDFTDYPAVS